MLSVRLGVRFFFPRFNFSTQKLSINTRADLLDHELEVDHKSLRNGPTQQKILTNLCLRGVKEDFEQLFEPNLNSEQLYERLVAVAAQLPNSIDPRWEEDTASSGDLHIVEYVNQAPEFAFQPAKAEKILFDLGGAQFSDMKTGKLGIAGGKRSYIFFDKVSRLARALTRWTLETLVKEYEFTPVVPPILIRPEIIRACGFEPFGQRSQVYTLEDKRSDTAVAGTAEMPLAALHLGEHFPTADPLPKRYCALSRCYRAEAKSPGEMSGLYRVHYFDKVEMFALTDSEEGTSSRMLYEFLAIQRHLFSQLGLHYRVVDMPPVELGAPASRKYDIEAYMPGRNFWGEISSTSNCIDYQARRLAISYDKFHLKAGEIAGVEKRPVNTVNGTACAVPRMIIAIVEQFQTSDGRVVLPEVLRPYLGFDTLEKS